MFETVEDHALELARSAPTTTAIPTPIAETPARPETLHPALWLGHQLGRQATDAVPSGFASLDTALPGHGWPKRCLSELLLPRPGIGEMRLLAPSLSATQACRVVMFFDPPLELQANVLASLGLDLDQLLVVSTQASGKAGNSLWALEQALKSGHVGAVVAWLPPRLRAESIRRLQLAAHNHDGIAFVFREAELQDRPSASPLRLALRAAGADRLHVRVVKRRGPPLLEPITLVLPFVLSAVARRRSEASVLDAPGRAAAEPGAARSHSSRSIR